MRKLTFFAALPILAATSSLAANLPNQTNIRGTYVEARTADVYTGPCFANSEMNLLGDTAVLGWHINQGTFDGVRLDGLSVVGVLRGKATLGDVHAEAYPVKSVLIVDEKATPEQRLALQAFAKRMAGDLLQHVVKVDYAPVEFTLDGDVHGRKATLTAGTIAAIQTRAMKDSDHLCHNEEIYFPPLTKTEHAMPAVTVAHNYTGKDLGMTWSSPDKRSAFVGTFKLAE